MFISKKHLSRRTFLRGTVGTAVALPLLDAMVPAATALAKTAANPVRRLGYVFMPMGCDQSRWTPPGEGTLGELSPILSSLAPVKEHVTVITNLEVQSAYPGSHATSKRRAGGRSARGAPVLRATCCHSDSSQSSRV